MKKLTAGIVSVVVALSATSVLAETPTVRQMNSFSHVLDVSNKNRVQAANPSEFVIYHQDAPHKPCPPHTKGKEKHKHVHGKKHGHAAKHADKADAKVKKAHKKDGAVKTKSDDNTAK